MFLIDNLRIHCLPVDKRCRFNVYTTSIQRRCRIEVLWTLKQRRVSTGLEWDYPVDSSSLPADLQWISFVLESAPWKILYLVCKMCKTCIIIKNFSPCNALSIKPQTTPKLSSQITCESLSYSLSVCFLYNILALNSQAKGN